MMTRILLALAIALTLSACAPFAQFARDLADTSDGATLEYVFRTGTTLPGLRFDPDGRAAHGPVLVATATSPITILATPDDVTCELKRNDMRMDCYLGIVVTNPVTINLTAAGVLANVTYRREGSNTPRMAFAR